MGKHRGCKWRHRWRATKLVAEVPGAWLFNTVCRRCGRRGSVTI